jgi:hypothetical protein
LLRGPSDREVIETMTHRGLDQRNSASGEVYDKPHAALYALLAGAEGCGPAARGARLAQHDELADFLCRVQEEIVEEAERLLDVRAAE